MNELVKTIQELTIQNKIFEEDITWLKPEQHTLLVGKKHQVLIKRLQEYIKPRTIEKLMLNQYSSHT